MELIKRFTTFFFDLIEIFVVAMAIFVVGYLFFFQPHQVKGSSMEPNFHDAEYILTDKISYRFSPPKRGDIVIFRAPKNRELDYIKRVIGLPKDKIRITNGKVFINGQQLKEDYLQGRITSPGSFLPEGKEYTVGENEYFCLGDNRPYSSDSRDWGTVVREDIIGKAWLKYWPPPNLGILANVKY